MIEHFNEPRSSLGWGPPNIVCVEHWNKIRAQLDEKYSWDLEWIAMKAKWLEYVRYQDWLEKAEARQILDDNQKLGMRTLRLMRTQREITDAESGGTIYH